MAASGSFHNIAALLPACKTTSGNDTDAVQRQCLWDFSSKGGVVYNQYEPCSRTDILLPGFDLLPTWLLGGARAKEITPKPRTRCACV